MDEHTERRRYYPDEENVPLSVAIMEVVRAHENLEVSTEEFTLYDHIDLDALDRLFKDSIGVNFSIQFDLPSSTVAVWGDGGVDIRVTDTDELP